MFNWLIGKRKPTASLPESRNKKSPALCSLDADMRTATSDVQPSCFFLGVWPCNTAISDSEAAGLYAILSEGGSTAEFSDAVYAFYSQLILCYPEIDLVPENELETCPWASAIDMSGTHVIMAIRPEKSAQVLPVVMTLAEQYGLVCFDPQAGKVHLPSRFRSTGAGA